MNDHSQETTSREEFKVKEFKLDRFNITVSIAPAGFVRIEEDPQDRYGANSLALGFALGAIFCIVVALLLNREEWYPVINIILALFTIGFTAASLEQRKFARSTGNKTYLFTPDCCEIVHETGRSKRYPKVRVLSVYTQKETTKDMATITGIRYDVMLKLKGRPFGIRRKKLLFFDSRIMAPFTYVEPGSVVQMEKECMELALIIARFWNIPAQT